MPILVRSGKALQSWVVDELGHSSPRKLKARASKSTKNPRCTLPTIMMQGRWLLCRHGLFCGLQLPCGLWKAHWARDMYLGHPQKMPAPNNEQKIPLGRKLGHQTDFKIKKAPWPALLVLQALLSMYWPFNIDRINYYRGEKIGSACRVAYRYI